MRLRLPRLGFALPPQQLARWARPLIVAAVLLLSAWIGYRPPPIPLFLLAGGLAGILLAWLAFRSMVTALTLLVATSAVLDFSLSTGTQSPVHFSLVVIIVCTAVWVLRMLLDKKLRLEPCTANRPLFLLNLAVLVSWVAGYAFWKPTVPRSDNAFTVQAGQVAMFVLSTAAFLLVANHPIREKDVRRWTGFIIVLGMGAVAGELVQALVTGSSRRLPGVNGAMLMWPFVLLWAQLLFNPNLTRKLRIAGWLSLALWGSWTWLRYLHFKGGWVPALLALGIMVLLRFRHRLFLFVVPAAIALLLVLMPSSPPGAATTATSDGPTASVEITSAATAVWSAVVTAEQESGSFLRLPIWYDILRMTARSPLLGLGPVSYMYYWRDPAFASYSLANSPNWWAWYGIGYAPPSHNMFVDILAQAGVVGLGIFAWAVAALILLANRARQRLPAGFLQAYAYGVLSGFLALLVGSFAFADWLIPFVYNIAIQGFQHSVYSWLLLGSLVPVLKAYAQQPCDSENTSLRRERTSLNCMLRRQMRS